MRRRYGRRLGNQWMRRPQTVSPKPPATFSGKPYIPDVRPFMRQSGYTEGLTEILAEVERIQAGENFYYEQGDLWRKKP